MRWIGKLAAGVALAVGTGLCGAPGGAAWGQEEPARAERDPRVNPGTGQDQRTWPPDVLFDYQHVRLELVIPDMAKPQFTGREKLRMAPIGKGRSQVRLRAGRGLTFTTISLDGKALDFRHDTESPGQEALTINLPREYALGEVFTLVMDYTANRPGGQGNGMTFSKDDPNTPEFDPMFHTQGQPESNHLWFAIHDFPNMRLTSEIVATVPEGFTAVSNGRLLNVMKRPARDGNPGTATFHWLQDKPHAAYLIALVAGNFDVVNVGGPESARPGLWLPVYGPRGSAEVLRRNFGNTADMVAHFEKLLDEPYPWDKYANIICRNFAAGAMENTSCTTFAPFGASGGRGMVEGVNAHELVHQWFGDLVGYKAWEHVWLGEGWATYGEALWVEKTGGKSRYQRKVAGDAAQARMASRGGLPETGGSIVTNLYTGGPDSRYNPLVAYAKGGWFLHTLRMRLGDEVFFKGVRLYLDRFRMKQAETDDFRHCLEEVSGTNLERYFEQFAYRPGVPRLRVDLTWEESTSTLGVAVEQIQKIDADNPAFQVSIPVSIDLGEGKSRSVVIDMDTRTASASYRLDGKPTKVVVDPNATVMAESRVRTPLAVGPSWWLEQLRTGPTEFARLQAADELAEMLGLGDGMAGRAARALAVIAASPGESAEAREMAAVTMLGACRWKVERQNGREVAGR